MDQRHFGRGNIIVVVIFLQVTKMLWWQKQFREIVVYFSNVFLQSGEG